VFAWIRITIAKIKERWQLKRKNKKQLETIQAGFQLFSLSDILI